MTVGRYMSRIGSPRGGVITAKGHLGWGNPVCLPTGPLDLWTAARRLLNKGVFGAWCRKRSVARGWKQTFGGRREGPLAVIERGTVGGRWHGSSGWWNAQARAHVVPVWPSPMVINRRRFSAAVRWCSQWSFLATPR